MVDLFDAPRDHDRRVADLAGDVQFPVLHPGFDGLAVGDLSGALGAVEADLLLDVDPLDPQVVGDEADEGDAIELADSGIEVDLQLAGALFDLAHGEAQAVAVPGELDRVFPLILAAEVVRVTQPYHERRVDRLNAAREAVGHLGARARLAGGSRVTLIWLGKTR